MRTKNVQLVSLVGRQEEVALYWQNLESNLLIVTLLNHHKSVNKSDFLS